MDLLSRRGFLAVSAGAGALSATSCVSPQADKPRGKPPFRILFGNDTTNIVSCPSPFKKREEPFRDEHLRASVAETAGTGIDVHLLQPGLGWVPWWQSAAVPMKQHVEWLTRIGKKPSSFENYVLAGGDMVRVFIDACRACGQTPFISIRLNDAHHIYRGGRAAPEEREKALSEFKFFADHPECRLGPDAGGDARMRYMLDWGRPEVRAYKLRLLDELCANYAFEGLELDYMRHWIFFNLKRTTAAQRREIQTVFVRQVRQLLDRTAKPGSRRWLCVRVPAYPDTYDAMGVDLAAFARAGVDMVNVSSHYFTDFQMELALLRRQLPDPVALYAEVQFVSATSQKLTLPATKETLNANRRTTREQFFTVAHQAYARGADGVSAFNFQYYRGTHNPTDVYGPRAEPPYDVFKRLGDPAWLARQPQHYALGLGQGHPKTQGRPFQDAVKPGETATLTLHLAPPAGGWRNAGRLRIQARSPLKQDEWDLRVNGAALPRSADVSEPYPNPYPVGLGVPDELLAWNVPASALKSGINTITLTSSADQPVAVTFLDLAMP